MISKWIACLLASTALVGVARVGGVHAADPEPVRITVITDMNDDLYDARSGRGGLDATRMAVADFGGSVLGRPVVVDALNDHNKAAEAPALTS
jgi:branched-chain amino acid transport system substrate-binding protein